MKFSDAMRLADAYGLPDQRNMNIQITTRFWNGEKPPVCAIGGANAVAGVAPVIEEGLVKNYMDYGIAPLGLRQRRIKCPECACAFHSVTGAIVELYDERKWSRTQIADWLDTLFTDKELEWDPVEIAKERERRCAEMVVE